MLSGEVLREVSGKIASASAIARGGHTNALQVQDALLALSYSDKFGVFYLLKPEWYAPHIAKAPDKSSVVGSALLERLRDCCVPEHLVKQTAGLIRVIVDRLNIALAPWNLGASNDLVDFVFRPRKIQPADFLFERKHVPATPALRMTMRHSGLAADSEVEPGALVDRTGHAPFALVGELEVLEAGSVVGADLALREVHSNRAPRESKIAALNSSDAMPSHMSSPGIP